MAQCEKEDKEERILGGTGGRDNETREVDLVGLARMNYSQHKLATEIPENVCGLPLFASFAEKKLPSPLVDEGFIWDDTIASFAEKKQSQNESSHTGLYHTI